MSIPRLKNENLFLSEDIHIMRFQFLACKTSSVAVLYFILAL